MISQTTVENRVQAKQSKDQNKMETGKYVYSSAQASCPLKAMETSSG